MKKLNIITSILIFLITSYSFAIRSVGNGGGLAEMRMIYIHQNLNRYLDICLDSKNYCELNSDELTEWKHLSEEYRIDKQKYQIDFKSNVDNPLGFELENQNIIIGSDHLYDDNGKYNSFNQLISFMMSIRFYIMGNQFNFDKNLNKFNQIFKMINASEFLYQVPNSQSLFRLSFLNIEIQTKKDSLVLIEDQKTSYSVNEQIHLALPCGHIGDWTFEQWDSQVLRDRIFIYAEGSATCVQEFQNKKLLLEFNINQDKYIIGESLKVRFFAY